MKHTVDASKVARQYGALAGEMKIGARNGVYDIADKIFGKSQYEVPVGCGGLAGSLKKSGNVKYDDLSATIGYNARSKGAPYPWYVHEGTGIYGPKNMPIKPKKMPFLQWRTCDGRWHRAKEIRGQRPQPFLDDAITKVLPEVPDIMRRRIAEALERGLGK